MHVRCESVAQPVNWSSTVYSIVEIVVATSANVLQIVRCIQVMLLHAHVLGLMPCKFELSGRSHTFSRDTLHSLSSGSMWACRPHIDRAQGNLMETRVPCNLTRAKHEASRGLESVGERRWLRGSDVIRP